MILPFMEMHVSINTCSVSMVSLSANGLSSSSEGPAVNADVSVPLVFRGEEVAALAQEDLPVKLSQVPAPPGSANVATSFPAHVFEPAVLLTPPRQKSSSGFSPLQEGEQASSRVVCLLPFYALNV